MKLDRNSSDRNQTITSNTAQKSNAGLSLRAEQFNHLKSENKCFAFSLSLSGTASALGTLAGLIFLIIFVLAECFRFLIPLRRPRRRPLAVMPVTQAIQVASP
jgi:hypothetical protein